MGRCGGRFGRSGCCLCRGAGATRPQSALDLSQLDAASRLAAETSSLDVGLLVYNAALSLIGPFLDQPLAAHLRELDTNCRAPLTLVHAFGNRLAEGLWAELGPHGVDVIACCAGAIATAGYARAAPARISRFTPAAGQPESVVAETLAALGGGPVVVPGRANRLGQVLLQRVLPRRAAIRLMERNTRALSSPPPGS